MESLGVLWSIAWGIGIVIASLAITSYATRKNTSNYESLKKNEIANLFEKVNLKMDEDKARETFVSKELNDEQIKHIDSSMNEIKDDQKEILRLLRK